MMKLSLIEMQTTVKDTVVANTGMPVFDVPPENPILPLLYVESKGKRDASTKTMNRERFRVWVHCITARENSPIEIYDLVSEVEEALSQTMDLPNGDQVFDVTESGLRYVEMGIPEERHVIVMFEIVVLYGYIGKV